MISCLSLLFQTTTLPKKVDHYIPCFTTDTFNNGPFCSVLQDKQVLKIESKIAQIPVVSFG